MIIKLVWRWICQFFRNRRAQAQQKKAAKAFLAKPNIIFIFLGGRRRRLVAAELVEENFHTFWVRLFDGHIIKRKKRRDLTEEGRARFCAMIGGKCPKNADACSELELYHKDCLKA